jgi:hypothetical protein
MLRASELMTHIMDYDHSLDLKEFLNQLNFLYIYNNSKIIGTRANEPHYEPEGYT